MVAVKLRGLPYEIRYGQYVDLFRGLNIVNQSAILGEGIYGNMNGYGSVLFKDTASAREAIYQIN